MKVFFGILFLLNLWCVIVYWDTKGFIWGLNLFAMLCAAFAIVVDDE